MLKNIVLVGLMGAGKSSVARYLGAKLHKDVVSTDASIEEKKGKPIPAIFEEEGETAFRKLEKDVVVRLAQREGIIIDCGGGVVTDPDNIDELQRKGVLFYISATPEFLYQNTKHQTHRPLLADSNPLEKIRTLLKDREEAYQRADYTLKTTGLTVEQIGEEIIKLLRAK